MSFLSYSEYHKQSMEALDVDPSIMGLNYLAERFELNVEQRYWLAFLYGTCYCMPTVYYMYNEFPDYSTVDPERLQRWWKRNKQKLIFQTDRMRIKSNDQFVPSFLSYRSLVGKSQHRFFREGTRKDPHFNYNLTYKKASRIKYFGRFSLFNFIDTLNRITPLNALPKTINLVDADSCRNGLAFAINRPDLVVHRSSKKLTKDQQMFLQNRFDQEKRRHEGDIFQIETTLCAYKKHRLGKRYVGYYIDRLHQEISKIQAENISGVDWSVLWQFRSETFKKTYLKEHENN